MRRRTFSKGFQTTTSILLTRTTLIVPTLIYNILLLYFVVVAYSQTPEHDEERFTSTKTSSSSLLVPIELDSNTFSKQIIHTPERPFWLVQFYAQYSQESIRLAPVLGKVANQVGDQMAIGKLDCSRYQPICKRYKIRVYPTHMFLWEGQLHPYWGNTEEESLLQFAQRMTKPAMRTVSDIEEANMIAASSCDGGVAFLGCGSKFNKSDKKYLEVYQRVARSLQASATFLWMPNCYEISNRTMSSFLVKRLEPALVPTRDWTFPHNVDDPDQLFEVLQSWIIEQQVPSLVTFHSNNNNNSLFQTPQTAMQRHPNRQWVWGIITDENISEGNVQQLLPRVILFYVQSTLEEGRQQYYFGYLHGSQWMSFLHTFGIVIPLNNTMMTDSPSYQFLLIDPSSSSYWLDYYTDLRDFLQAVQNNTLSAKQTIRSLTGDRGMHWVAELFLDFYPMSLGVVLMSICGIVILCTNPPSDPTPIPKTSKRPKRQLKAQAEPITRTPTTTTNSTEHRGKKETDKKED